MGGLELWAYLSVVLRVIAASQLMAVHTRRPCSLRLQARHAGRQEGPDCHPEVRACAGGPVHHAANQVRARNEYVSQLLDDTTMIITDLDLYAVQNTHR